MTEDRNYCLISIIGGVICLCSNLYGLLLRSHGPHMVRWDPKSKVTFSHIKMLQVRKVCSRLEQQETLKQFQWWKVKQDHMQPHYERKKKLKCIVGSIGSVYFSYFPQQTIEKPDTGNFSSFCCHISSTNLFFEDPTI